jgi:hypothetical protein
MAVIDLIASIKSLTDQFVQFGKDFERRSLGLGLNFEQASQRLGKGFDQLHGDMQDRMQVGLQSVAAGLKTTDGGLSQLINQQKLTGQQWQNTAGVWANVVAAGVANEEAMKVLAENTINLGDTYTVQTSLLTGVIKSLERSMVDMGLADMGPQVLGAITELQAVMGPQQKANFEKINQMIFDTSIEGYQKLALLNIPNIREQLSAARTQGEAASLLMDAIKTAGMTIDDFTSDADQAFIRLGQAGQIFGQSAKLFSPVAKALEEDARKSTEERTKFFEQWNVMLTDVMAPLKLIASQLLFPNLRNFVTAITDFGKVLVDKIKAFIGPLDDTVISVDAFKRGILIAANGVVDAFELVITLSKYLWQDYLPPLIEASMDFFRNKIADGMVAFQIMWADMKLHSNVFWINLKNKAEQAWDNLKLKISHGWDDLMLKLKKAVTFGAYDALGLKRDLMEDQQRRERSSMMLLQRQEDKDADRLIAGQVISNLASRIQIGFEGGGMRTKQSEFPTWSVDLSNKVSIGNQILADLLTDSNELVEQTANINDKIPDPNEGGLLAESAFILGDAIERVLGFDAGSQGIDLQEEMRDLLAQIAEERAVPQAALVPVVVP